VFLLSTAYFSSIIKSGKVTFDEDENNLDSFARVRRIDRGSMWGDADGDTTFNQFAAAAAAISADDTIAGSRARSL
jgi:hypothetical protein